MFKKLLLITLLCTSLGAMAQTDTPLPATNTTASAPSWSRNITGADTSFYFYTGGKGIQVVGRRWLANNYATISGTATNPSIARVVRRIFNNTAVSFAFEGNSITYGQQVGGPVAPINGSSIDRALYQYPESFHTSLDTAYKYIYPSLNVTVTNRGYPGDNTATGITRWAAAPVVDVVFIMYGINDANNYGGQGVIEIPQYKANLVTLAQRRINQGSAVVFVSPVDVASFSANANAAPYREAMKQVATAMNIPFVDGNQQINWMQEWLDGVHLTALTNLELGWHLAALFLPTPLIEVAPKQEFHSNNNISYGGTETTLAASTTGKVTKLAQGEKMMFTFNVKQRSKFYIKIINPSAVANSGSIAVNYANNKRYSIPTVTPISGTTMPQRFYIDTLAPGIRTIYLTNLNLSDAYIDGVGFDDVIDSLNVNGNLRMLTKYEGGEQYRDIKLGIGGTAPFTGSSGGIRLGFNDLTTSAKSYVDILTNPGNAITTADQGIRRARFDGDGNMLLYNLQSSSGDSLVVHDNTSKMFKRLSPSYYLTPTGNGSGLTNIPYSAITGTPTIPTIGSNTYIQKSNGTNLVNSLITDNGTQLNAVAPFVFQNVESNTVDLTGSSAGIYYGVSPNGYFGYRQGTDHSFNIDSYNNGGTQLNVLKIAQGGGFILPQLTGSTTDMVTITNTGQLGRTAIPSGGGGGTVVSVGVNSANGFGGSSSGGTNPALTITTSVNGIVKGNGTAVSAAAAGTDYTSPSSTETMTNKTISGGIYSGTSNFTGTAAFQSGNLARWYRADNAVYNEIKYDTGDKFVLNQNNGGSFSFRVNGSEVSTISSSGAYSGSATSLSTASTLPNNTLATTQSAGDSTTNVATDAFVMRAVKNGGGDRPYVVTSSSSVALSVATDYFFTGTTSTFGLPDLSNGDKYRITIKNRGSGNITVNGYDGGANIYTTSAVSSETIAPGAAVTYISDGTYWNHE